MERMERADPIESREATEPTLSPDPALPTLNNEPADSMEATAHTETMDHMDMNDQKERTLHDKRRESLPPLAGSSVMGSSTTAALFAASQSRVP